MNIKKILVLFLVVTGINYSYAQLPEQSEVDKPVTDTPQILEYLTKNFAQIAQLMSYHKSGENSQPNPDWKTELEKVPKAVRPYAQILFSCRLHVARESIANADYERLPMSDRMPLLCSHNDIIAAPVTQEEILFIQLLRCKSIAQYQDLFSQHTNINEIYLHILLDGIYRLIDGNPTEEQINCFMPVVYEILKRGLDFTKKVTGKYALADIALSQNIDIESQINELNNISSDEAKNRAINEITRSYNRLKKIYESGGYLSRYLIKNDPKQYIDSNQAVGQFITQITLARNNPGELDLLIQKAIAYDCPEIIEQIVAQSDNLVVVNGTHLNLAKASNNDRVTQVIQDYLTICKILLTLRLTSELEQSNLSALPSEITMMIARHTVGPISK